MITYQINNWTDGYKGIDRDFSIPGEFFRHDKKTTDMLLDYAFRYYDIMHEPSGRENFEEMLAINRVFRDNGVMSAVICHDNNKMNSIYGYQIEFLGIDMAIEQFESCLTGDCRNVGGLNNHGLFATLEAALTEIHPCGEGGYVISPVYVYLVSGTDR